jgi:hypothetical protein
VAAAAQAERGVVDLVADGAARGEVQQLDVAAAAALGKVTLGHFFFELRRSLFQKKLWPPLPAWPICAVAHPTHSTCLEIELD